jgi:hypothetical protein
MVSNTIPISIIIYIGLNQPNNDLFQTCTFIRINSSLIFSTESGVKAEYDMTLDFKHSKDRYFLETRTMALHRLRSYLS